jgi:hydroxysqualene synthase
LAALRAVKPVTGPQSPAVSVDHYENFPVASWLCPARLRPAVSAIYWFARTADDIADEGSASSEERLSQLSEYRRALSFAARGEQDPQHRWPQVFEPLRRTIAWHELPETPLADLLDAFEQDVRNPVYDDRAQLLDYCRRSANPIGRLLLHLYHVRDELSLQQSDRVCTALQLINFWQDLGIDLARGRCYLTREDLARHGLRWDTLLSEGDNPHTQQLVAGLCDWAGDTLEAGAPLVHRLPGRAGWELRLVVQGGRRVLEKIRRMHHRSLHHRPTLSFRDVPLMFLRGLAMRAPVRAAEPA